MRSKIFSMFIVGLLLLLVASPFTRARGEVISTATTAAAILNIKNLLSGIIDKASNSGDYLMFRLGTEMRISIESWEKANSNLIDKAFSKLEQQQQVFLSGVDSLATKLSNEVEKSFDSIEGLSNQWHNLVSSTPIGDGVPIVSSFSRLFIRPTDLNKRSTINVNGANLGHGKPNLVVPGAKTSLIGNWSTGLSFSIEDLSLNFHESYVSTVHAELILFRPHTNLIKRAIGQLEEMKFKLPIMVGPSILGTYDLTISRRELVEKIEPKTEKFLHSSGSLDRDCKTFSRGPSVVGRGVRDIRVEVTRRGRESSHKLVSQSSQGFSLEICAQRYWIVAYTGPGDRHVDVSWTEHWKEEETKTEARSGSLSWGGIVEQLPASTSGFVLKIRPFDGRELIFVGPTKKSFLDVSYDAVNKNLLISQDDTKITY